MKIVWLPVEVMRDKVGAGPFAVCEWMGCDEIIESDGAVVFEDYGPTKQVKIYHQNCWIREPGEMWRPLHEFLTQLQNNSGRMS